jgi:hypothetical protein
MGALTRQLGGDVESAKADNTAAQVRAERLASAMGTRVHVPVTIPRTQVSGSMRLLSRSEQLAVKTEAILALKKIPDVMWMAGVAREDFNAELAIRTLAIAVRDPVDPKLALDDVQAWRDLLDDEQIGAVYHQYEDLRVQLDPLGEAVALTEEEFRAIEAAVKKKDASLLMRFGLRKLALFATTLGEPPASSPTPTS